MAAFERMETELGTRYMIVGGVLTPLYAETRYTSDLDIVLSINPENVDLGSFRAFLTTSRFQPFTSWNDALDNWPDVVFFTMLAPDNPVKVDVNILREDQGPTPPSPYTRVGILALPRRTRITVGDLSFWAQSKEDFILAKLVYQGIQDYTDALACYLRNQKTLDVAYLKTTADELDVVMYLTGLLEQRPVSDIFPEDI